MTYTTKSEKYFHVFRELIRSMCSTTSFQEVLNGVVTNCTEALNAKGALLRILNKETNLFEVRAACGLGTHYLSKGPVTTKKLLASGSQLYEVQIISDIWHAPRVEYPQATWDEGIRMMVDMPIAIDQNMVGLMRVYLAKQRKFFKDELDFIKTVAMHCACVIERVSLMEKQKAQFTHLTVRMDKLSSLGRMAAGIAHEINNPLTGILLYSSNLSKKVPMEGALKEGLEIIIKETQRCKIIIQGLLEFAREHPLKKEPANVNDIIESSLGILENEFHLQHVSIKKELAKDMVKTLLDENQTEQVLINFFLNALNAVGNNGIITVKSEVDLEENKIHIEIADNGCGIAADNIKKIFDPFFSTKANGTGLGLAVSYGIIKNHQGDIQVFSELGRGTHFKITLPALVDNSTGKEGL